MNEEPSARLRDAVLAEAQALERAQATRREAIRDILARAGSAEEALGAPVSPQTETWLRQAWLPQQGTRHEGARPVSPRRAAWWRPGLAFGASCGIALLVGLAVYRDGPPAPGEQFAPYPEIALAEPAPPLPAAVAMEPALAERAASAPALARAAPQEFLAAEAEFSADTVQEESAAAMLSKRADVGGGDPDIHTHPISEKEHWARLAASFAENAGYTESKRAQVRERRQWRLWVNASDAEDVRGLVAFLRGALPAGAELVVEAESRIPPGYARLDSQ